MSKLSQIRNPLLISHSDNIMSDEELLLLYDVNKLNNLNLSYHSYPRFNLDDMSLDEAKSEFRFLLKDIYELINLLNIPVKITC